MVGLDVKIFLVRVLSSRRVGEASPPPPQKKKVFSEKNQKLFQILILFDDDSKESVKATDVQKCNFSQS